MELINIITMCFLLISLVLFEIGYKKENRIIFIIGIEFLLLSGIVLFTEYITKIFNIPTEEYIKTVLYVFGAYYIIKVGLLYTKKRYDKLLSLSDIKEIVKDEPQKKISKRKNIKVEEGK